MRDVGNRVPQEKLKNTDPLRQDLPSAEANALLSPAAIPRGGHPPADKLGQNFLIDMNLQRVLLEAADVGPRQRGPGGRHRHRGADRPAGPAAAAVVTVELDPQLFHLAGEELFGLENVTMLQADALKNKNRLNPAVLEAVAAQLARRAGRLQARRQSPLQHRHAGADELLALDRPPETMTLHDPEGSGRADVARPGTKDYGALAIWMQSQCRCRIVRIRPDGLLAAAESLFRLRADRA